MVFKHEKISGTTYRFAIVNYSRSDSFPSNFVCMLPAKVELIKGKSQNVFGELFGDNSVDFAKELLNNALKSESEEEIKTEIERRLKLIDGKQVYSIKCSGCNKTFQPRKIRKHKHNFCPDCLKKRY
jgi:hypothetical protein